ncbi:hypothetical protein P171DRAFT_100849 [Karstenula rhodostoma CBS 690.94]|uniref:Uncharacterized protein n=1 Tax=Karstenula rhodostoma CBS 690.94 TaxID=1392251 RepID=A0A9P4PAU6_9PLEO|nr:hypothetical protein P171DRAFT_100849 [Karstenula rhodostoma CBS 690.94]
MLHRLFCACASARRERRRGRCGCVLPRALPGRRVSRRQALSSPHRSLVAGNQPQRLCGRRQGAATRARSEDETSAGNGSGGSRVEAGVVRRWAWSSSWVAGEQWQARIARWAGVDGSIGSQQFAVQRMHAQLTVCAATRRRVSSGPSVLPAHVAYLAACPHVARGSLRNGSLSRGASHGRRDTRGRVQRVMERERLRSRRLEPAKARMPAH